MRTLISCVKQKATPNLKEAKADTIVALPSLNKVNKIVYFNSMQKMYIIKGVPINMGIKCTS